MRPCQRDLLACPSCRSVSDHRLSSSGLLQQAHPLSHMGEGLKVNDGHFVEVVEKRVYRRGRAPTDGDRHRQK